MTFQETPDVHLSSAVLPERLFGLTIDKVSDPDITPDTTADTIIKQLETIKRETGRIPMVRIVFDGNKNPLHYREVLERIKSDNLGYVMGEILDSFAVQIYRENRNQISEQRYRERTQHYLAELGGLVHLWEIGNEMNGEWVGYGQWEDKQWTAEDMENIRNTYARAVGKAYKVITEAGKDTAITFYFNDDGVRHTWPDGKKKLNPGSSTDVLFGHHYSMLTWAETYRDHFPEVKYVFVSYYEDDQFADDPRADRRTRIIPTADVWASIFKRLRELYGQAQFGFGEMGSQCYFRVPDPSCTVQENNKKFAKLKPKKRCVLVKNEETGEHRRCACCLNAQREYINRYYVNWDRDIRSALANLPPAGLDNLYIGGYFYWHFNDDVINKIAKSNEASTPAEEKRVLQKEATDTLNALIAAFRQW